MDSKTIVDAYGAKLSGQGLLFEDHDYTLRHTPFKEINPQFDREAVVHWWMNVYVPDGWGDDRTPQEIHETWSSAIFKTFLYIHQSGYNPRTNQTSIDIACIGDVPVEPQLEELRMWLSEYKPIPTEGDGDVHYVGIFESTLSEFGIYHLEVYDDESCIIRKTTYGRPEILSTFDNLKSALDYIRLNLWYQKTRDGQDESEAEE